MVHVWYFKVAGFIDSLRFNSELFGKSEPFPDGQSAFLPLDVAEKFDKEVVIALLEKFKCNVFQNVFISFDNRYLSD